MVVTSYFLDTRLKFTLLTETAAICGLAAKTCKVRIFKQLCFFTAQQIVIPHPNHLKSIYNTPQKKTILSLKLPNAHFSHIDIAKVINWNSSFGIPGILRFVENGFTMNTQQDLCSPFNKLKCNNRCFVPKIISYFKIYPVWTAITVPVRSE